ncbi:MAG TPA: dihydroorotase [Syntrophobacteraceae bacterium]|nr:dihydroorotase [Syntrophobacteraceae bacterium]
MMEAHKNSVNLVLRKGRVIDPAQGLDAIMDVVIEKGTIVEMGPGVGPPPAGAAGEAAKGAAGRSERSRFKQIDASGKWIVPGLIDMHVHLREPGEEYKETIASGTLAAAAGGFTSVACMPNTHPVNDCAAVTQFIIEKAREEGFCRVFPVGAISQGLEGKNISEYGDLRAAGAVAVSDDGRPVMSSLLMRRALEYAGTFGLLVISHCEDLELSGQGAMNEGAVCTKLGLRGIPRAAEEIMVARDIVLAELTGSRLHLAHISTAGSVALIREAKKRGVPVTAETAPHYFTLDEELIFSYDPVYKVNPPLRRLEDIEAVKAGLRDGTIDVIASDHAPHSAVEKDIEFEYAANGVIGLESSLPLILRLVNEGLLSPLEAVSKVTSNPARILQIPFGTLGKGMAADLSLIDPEVKYGIDVSRFKSKSRNCPFAGMQVQGKALMTFVGGRVVHTG